MICDGDKSWWIPCRLVDSPSSRPPWSPSLKIAFCRVQILQWGLLHCDPCQMWMGLFHAFLAPRPRNWLDVTQNVRARRGPSSGLRALVRVLVFPLQSYPNPQNRPTALVLSRGWDSSHWWVPLFVAWCEGITGKTVGFHPLFDMRTIIGGGLASHSLKMLEQKVLEAVLSKSSRKPKIT